MLTVDGPWSSLSKAWPHEEGEHDDVESYEQDKEVGEVVSRYVGTPEDQLEQLGLVWALPL